MLDYIYFQGSGFIFNLLDFTGNGIFNSADMIHAIALYLFFRLFYNTIVRR